ncbi:MAG: zinc-binding alcohol dehydrogenase [Ruminococcaceae bacterium]|nr:zinc-binding alcohol dehydrogenase [Oscillospiraceae bacterium]
MKQNKRIVFTKPNTAELLDCDYVAPGPGQVVVETAFSTVSPGTEKANFIGDPNVAGSGPSNVVFPRYVGYSSSGVIVEKGSGVTDFEIGDRVAVFTGIHARYKTMNTYNVIKINDSISLSEAAMCYIVTFPLAAVRKTRLEIGESALVMGLGLLGQIAVRQLKTAGAAPIIAVDPVESRRKEALEAGADYAFDPYEEGFAGKVRAVSNGGVNVAIEVTGVGAGLDGALDCMARFGRVALLGCTRDKEFTIDYYRKVHFPGITLIGAHTMARPDFESSPGWHTHPDDIKTMFKLIEYGRIDIKPLIKEIHSPEDCGAVYTRLATDRAFPSTIQFDWSMLK